MPLLFADRDADSFGQYLNSGKAGKFDSREIAVLQDEQADFDRMTVALRKALMGAQPGDSVYLFISARGIARPDAKDGYLGTSGFVEIKPESTGIAVSDLAQMIRYSKASRVYLFADVCRQPSPPKVDNRINFRMEDLGAIPKLSGILASEKQKLSIEDPRMQHGVFSYVLINGLTQHTGRSITPAEVYDYLRRELALATGDYKQIPKQVGGNPILLKAPLWVSGIAFPRFAGPLAGLRFLPGLLAMQVAQSAPRTLADDYLRPERLTDPKALAESVNALKPTLSPADWEELRDRVVTAIAARGQQAVAEYGVTGLLPEDPRKLGAGDFDSAALSFEAATALIAPGDPVLGGYRTSLEARRNMCSGIAHAYRHEAVAARRDLDAARQLAGRSLPEIDNATGISYLEEGTAYGEAIRYFQLAKSESPAWPYPRHNLALAFAERGDAAAAEREYREAIARAPDEPYLDYNLGLILHRANRKREARKAYEDALGKMGAAAKTYAARSREWKDALPEESRIAFARAAMFEKMQADVHNALGALFESQGAAKLAVKEYQAALDANADLCPARYNLALLRRAPPEETRTMLAETIKRCPMFHPARVRLAALDLRAGRVPEAEAGYTEVLRQVAGNIEARRGLARVRLEQKRFPEAEALIGELGDPLSAEELGDIAAARGDQRACALYKKAMSSAKSAVYEGDVGKLREKVRNACR